MKKSRLTIVRYPQDVKFYDLLHTEHKEGNEETHLAMSIAQFQYKCINHATITKLVAISHALAFFCPENP
jgi:hypothetical protein